MPNKNFNSLAEFESFVSQTISSWPNEKRTVLAAAMADRWLPVYEAFSDKNEFGDLAPFEDAVQIVWNCIISHHKPTAQDIKLHRERTKKNTPHVDDFDCEDALAAIGIIDYALDCCHHNVNTAYAAGAMTFGLQGVEPALFYEPEEVSPDVFHEGKLRNEIEKQLKLLEVTGNMAQIDQQSIEALRQMLRSSDLSGPVAPRPKSSRGPTNMEIFERYRKGTESDINNLLWKHNYSVMEGAITMVFSMWGRRYLRRKHYIEKLVDVPARNALVTKNSTYDAAVQGDPGWDDMTRLSITATYPHPESGYDVKSPKHPHSYGPSFRRLCLEGGPAGAWQWAYHVPPAWEEEDRRKEKQFTYTAPELEKLLTGTLSWQATAEVDHPWSTDVSGEKWRVRLNDFPDEIMYTLVINDAVIGNFHDWPTSWRRDDAGANET